MGWQEAMDVLITGSSNPYMTLKSRDSLRSDSRNMYVATRKATIELESSLTAKLPRSLSRSSTAATTTLYAPAYAATSALKKPKQTTPRVVRTPQYKVY